MNSYFDDLGRVHTKPIKPEDNFPTNNAWIYTAINETLRTMNDKAYGKHINAINQCNVWGFHGLYSRHPEPYRFKEGMVPVSHDEIIGIAMLDIYSAVRIVIQSPYFCDIPSYEKPNKLPFYRKIKPWASFLYRIVVKKETSRKITKQYPELFNTFFTHRRQYRYIYQSLSGFERTLGNAVAWASARILDSLTSSVSLLHYMAMIRMEQRGNKSFLFKLVAKMMKRSIMRKYGDRPVQAMLIEYLLNGTGTVDKNHPWLIEITEYYGNKGE